MSGAELGLGVSVFLACAVEAVEALTIVLAVGSTRSWAAAMSGVGAATLALAALVAALGPALASLPIDALRVTVGGLLLIFGLQWLRKAILRSAGLKAKHDELDEYQREIAAASAAGGRSGGFDGYSFAIAFKGVLLEGLEVAFIVITFGANQHRVGLAAAAAALAVIVVVLAGFAARTPLAMVPENTMKFAVGVMLSSYGMFWGAEGAGAHWPAGDAALLAIIPGVLLAAIALTSERATGHALAGASPAPTHAPGHERSDEVGEERSSSWPAAVVSGAWEFVVGDDWRTAVGVVLALALTALIAAAGAPAWWAILAAVLGLLAISIRREARGASRPAVSATFAGEPT
jgi:uncharacterized membrane protein